MSIQIIGLIISILSLLGVGSVLSWFWKESLEKKKTKTVEAQAEEKKRKQADMREVIQEELRPLEAQIEELQQDLSLDKEATIALLRDKMHRTYKECKEKGYATATQKANWHELYNAYQKLGGNHFAEYVNQWRDGLDVLPLQGE